MYRVTDLGLKAPPLTALRRHSQTVKPLMAEKTEEGEGGERRRGTSYLGEESTFRLYLDELSDRVVAVAGPLRTVAGVVCTGGF